MWIGVIKICINIVALKTEKEYKQCDTSMQQDAEI
jgi:hypothetical protein